MPPRMPRLPAQPLTMRQLAAACRVLADRQKWNGGRHINEPGYETSPTQDAYDAINEMLDRLAAMLEEMAIDPGPIMSASGVLKEKRNKGEGI